MKKCLLLYVLVLITSSGSAQNSISMDSLYALPFEQLMNIDITVASKQAERVSDAPGVISVLTREDIDRFGGMSLKDILERVPSLTTLSGSCTDRNAIGSRGDMVKSLTLM